jgi:hypothetical protein
MFPKSFVNIITNESKNNWSKNKLQNNYKLKYITLQEKCVVFNP